MDPTSTTSQIKVEMTSESSSAAATTAGTAATTGSGDSTQQQQQTASSNHNNDILVVDSDSVCVSIEPNHESEIFEIRPDGTEVYKEPLTYSENLAQLISKIDFHIDDGDDPTTATTVVQSKLNDTSGDEPSTNKNGAAAEPESESTINNPQKFYQNVYERVRSSMEEVSVLLDCLLIARANQFIGLETGHLLSQSFDDKQGENMEKSLNIVLKKRNIEKSKALLRKSQEKWSTDQEASNKGFHSELYRARQTWRIKKTGNKFTCDLSYRTVGVNAIRMSLELIKNELPVNNEIERNSHKPHQYLSVVIPDELKDYTYIQVKIIKNSRSKKKSNSTVFDRKFSLFTYSMSHPNIPSWQEELEREQNSIYCKEIYNKMLREIFDPSTQLAQKPVIMGNSMQITISMEYDLLISLVHSTERNFKNQQPPKDYNFDNAILEYYLHCLLKKSFDQNYFHFEQRPVTSSFAYNGQVKLAGMSYANLNQADEDDTPASVGTTSNPVSTTSLTTVGNLPNNLAHLLNKKKQINLLHSIKQKAEHLIIRKKVLRILSDVAKQVNEPHLIVEHSAWNSSTTSDLNVSIGSSQFECMARSFFYITIKQSSVHVLNRSANSNISFTDSVADLKNFFLDQCTFHQINLIVTLSQSFGWTLLGSSFTNELNTSYMTGVGLIYHSKHAKKIGIKVGPVNHIQVYVNQYDAASIVGGNNEGGSGAMDTSLRKMLGDSNLDWIFVKDNFAKVDLDAYPGWTKMQKFELLLAHYSTNQIV